MIKSINEYKLYNKKNTRILKNLCEIIDFLRSIEAVLEGEPAIVESQFMDGFLMSNIFPKTKVCEILFYNNGNSDEILDQMLGIHGYTKTKRTIKRIYKRYRLVKRYMTDEYKLLLKLN